MKNKNAGRLEFRGGIYGLIIPFLILFVGIMWLALTGKALPMAFWVPTLLAILSAFILAKNPRECADTIIKGMASEVVAIMLMAWFLAGIIAQLMKITGLIQGLVWLGLSIVFPCNKLFNRMLTFNCNWNSNRHCNCSGTDTLSCWSCSRSRASGYDCIYCMRSIFR